MRSALTALAMLALASAAAAPLKEVPYIDAGGPPAKDDIAAIDQCVRDAKDDPYACLGRVEKPCEDAPAGETTGGAMRCADRETAVWAMRAKAASDAIAARLEPGRLRLFRAADEAWVSYRNAACSYEASIYMGGTLAKVVAADCVLRETADRALELEDNLRSESQE